MKGYTRSGAVIPSHVGGGMGQNPGGSMGVRLGYIKKVVFPEDRENLTGALEYVVNIGGQDFYGCLDVVSMGGIFNNHIKVRKGQTPEMNPKAMLPFTTDDQKNGDAVWCLFIKDNYEHPLIVGSASHPRSEENADYLKPSKSLGQMERYEFNGLEFLINKDGDFTLTQKGLKHPVTGKAVPPQTGYFKFDKTGNFEVKTTLGTIIQVLDSDNKISLRTPAGDKVELSPTDGMQVEVTTGAKASFKDGKIDLESPSDVSVKSSAGKVSVEGATDISIKGTAGNVALEGSTAKLKLGTGKVGLGGPAGELIAEMEKLAQAVIDDATAAAAHIHPTAVGPSGPPTTAASFTAVVAAATAIKGILTALKGGI